VSAPANPQAFPATGEGLRNPHYSEPGMSLRDYFAAKVLAVVLRDNADGGCIGTFADESARVSYHVADAMLAAREQSA
jgi:hypothetical protein